MVYQARYRAIEFNKRLKNRASGCSRRGRRTIWDLDRCELLDNAAGRAYARVRPSAVKDEAGDGHEPAGARWRTRSLRKEIT